MSAHAKFCLLTLLILMGLMLGLWSARHAASMPSTSQDGSATRGHSAGTLCSHVAVGFDSQLSMQQLGRILRAEDASIVYGPDEFGEYHLRFSTGVAPEQGIQSLKARPQIQQLTAHPQCQ